MKKYTTGIETKPVVSDTIFTNVEHNTIINVELIDIISALIVACSVTIISLLLILSSVIHSQL